MSDMTGLVEKRIEQSIAVKRDLMKLSPEIARAGEVLLEAYRSAHKAIFFGNGGSAADSQHLAAELVGRYAHDRPPLPALALTVNTSCVTAISNDYAFDDIFVRQLRGIGQAGDVAVGISTSGNSENVLRGIRVAKEIGMITVGLAGQGGGRLREEAEHCICVPSGETPRIQEGHILVGHILCEIVEAGMFPRA